MPQSTPRTDAIRLKTLRGLKTAQVMAAQFGRSDTSNKPESKQGKLMDTITKAPAARASGSRLRALAARIGGVLASELGIGAVAWRFLALNAMVSILPSYAMYRTRAFLYRLAGFTVARGAVLHGKLTLMGHGNTYARLVIGEGCRVNTPCAIGLMDEVILEDRAVIGYGVTIITAVHQTDCPECRAGDVYGKPVRVCEGAWLAANVTVLPGVTIGPGAIIGAGSVVTRDVPPHTFAAGVPARHLRSLNLPSELQPVAASSQSPDASGGLGRTTKIA